MTLLLDTSTFVWLCSDPGKLGRQYIDVLPLQRPVLYRAGALPAVHKDPFDRVIAADALQRDLRVVSPDAPFKAYGCATIW